MSFLDKDTMKSLEGKFLKWQDGVRRELKLIAHKSEEREWEGKKRISHVITVIDQELNEEKEFNANKDFMQKLARLDNNLRAGQVLYVTPHAKELSIDGRVVNTFTFDISLKSDDIQF